MLVDVKAAAARCPPADPPPAAILLGKICNSLAFSLKYLIADLASSKASLGVVPCTFFNRYEAQIATIPRLARYSDWGKNCSAVPLFQPPP